MKALTVRSISKRYGNVPAVNKVNFSVERGSVFGLLGPNGAGKTTTLEMIEGLRDPDSGEILIFGDNWRTKPWEIRERIGVQLQTSVLFDKLTLAENLSFARKLYSRGIDPAAALKDVGLEGMEKHFPWMLSGGQRQRLALSVTLINDPDLVFLDEPTTGLDPQARIWVWEYILKAKQKGKTIVVTTHYMEEAERICDLIGIMDKGNMVAMGTPKQLMDMLPYCSVIQFSILELPDQTLEELDNLDGVTGRALRANLQVLYSNDQDKTLNALQDWSLKHRLLLRGLTIRTTNLEDVFINLTGGRLNEAPNSSGID